MPDVQQGEDLKAANAAKQQDHQAAQQRQAEIRGAEDGAHKPAQNTQEPTAGGDGGADAKQIRNLILKCEFGHQCRTVGQQAPEKGAEKTELEQGSSLIFAALQ